jgi:hypothetical protein
MFRQGYHCLWAMLLDICYWVSLLVITRYQIKTILRQWVSKILNVKPQSKRTQLFSYEKRKQRYHICSKGGRWSSGERNYAVTYPEFVIRRYKSLIRTSLTSASSVILFHQYTSTYSIYIFIYKTQSL